MAHAHVLVTDTGAAPSVPTPQLHDASDGLSVLHRGQLVHVATADIRLIEARGNYALIYTAGAKYMIRGTMTALEARLDARGFLRVHRSVILNLAYLKEVVPRRSGDHTAVLTDGTRLRFGRLYYARMRQQRR